MMKIKKGFSNKIISFLLVVVLEFTAISQFIIIDTKADSLDAITYKVSFENYTEGDVSHISTEDGTVRNGNTSAKLTGSGDSNATVNNAVYLVDENGVNIKYREGYTYLIGGYVKAEAGYTENIRIDMTKDLYWLNWSENTQVTAKEEWQYIWIECAIEEGNSASGLNVGLYANGLFNDKKIYIDDVTVIVMKSNYCGAIILNENNTDIKYFTGKIGDKFELPKDVQSVNPNKIFKKWYENKELTSPIDTNSVYFENVSMFYAGFTLNKWTVGYEEGSSYNWNSEKEVLKTENVSVSSEKAKTGNYSLKIEANKTGDVASFIIADIIESNGYATKYAFSDSRKYKVSFWYYVSENSAETNGYFGLYPCFTNSMMDFSAEITDESNRLILNNDDIGQWKQYSVIINTPECDDNPWVGAIRLGWLTTASNTDSIIYLDDIEIKTIVSGDYNYDNRVNVLDLVRLKKHLANPLVIVDLDNDVVGTVINSLDLVYLRKILLGAYLPPIKKDRMLVWSDEFSSDKIDFDRWGFSHTMYSNDRVFDNSETCCRIENGNLLMQAHRNDDVNMPFRLSEGFTTKNTMNFKYGYVEMRAKIPFRHGCWPSFWMQSKTPFSKADWFSEIDIFEVFSSENNIVANIHKWGDNGHVNYDETDHIRNYEFENFENLNNEYHIYALEWDEKEISMYVDDIKYATFSIESGKGDFGDEVIPGLEGFHDFSYIIMNNELFTENGSVSAPDICINDNDKFPVEYSIDWVKLYQNPEKEDIKLSKEIADALQKNTN